jgi:hypothetical protein
MLLLLFELRESILKDHLHPTAMIDQTQTCSTQHNNNGEMKSDDMTIVKIDRGIFESCSVLEESMMKEH